MSLTVYYVSMMLPYFVRLFCVQNAVQNRNGLYQVILSLTKVSWISTVWIYIFVIFTLFIGRFSVSYLHKGKGSTYIWYSASSWVIISEVLRSHGFLECPNNYWPRQRRRKPFGHQSSVKKIVERRDDGVTRAHIDAKCSRLLASMSATRQLVCQVLRSRTMYTRAQRV